MRLALSIFLALFTILSFSQTIINGVVKDKKGEPIFAANIFTKSLNGKGVTTDFNGNFIINSDNFKDTLLVSFIGYETSEIILSTIDTTTTLIVILKESDRTLKEVVIAAQDPISEQFSVFKMKKLDIYFNPVSQGDPLKAITILPFSTTTDETADVSLRGSSADRSRVILNGVPIYKPTRASNLNNQGFFSLFNPEVINNQYVYASNPPLSYGNTSAGLVEIQTINSLEINQLQLASSLASVGFFLSQRIKKDTSFIQVYGNYQFSDVYVGIQKKNLPQIKSFYTTDAGINYHRNFGKKIEFNSFNYYINEQFSGLNESFTYKGEVSTRNERVFTVNNLKYYSKKGILTINNGANKSKQYFRFGNINSEQKISQIHTTANYRWYFLKNAPLQFGISHDFSRNLFIDSVPIYYYALSPNSPNYFSGDSIHNHIFEIYGYSNWDINEKLTVSAGVRNNIPAKGQKYYLSSQIGLKYRFHNNHSLLLSGGKYHSYSVPNIYSKSYNLLTSYQLVLDYVYNYKNTLLKAATYFKNESGDHAVNVFAVADETKTFGVELFLEQSFYRYFKFSFANSFINQTLTINNFDYHGTNDFNYLIKSSLQYNNPKLFTCALTYISRPGTYYTPVTGSEFNNTTDFYRPIFSTELYDAQFSNYNRLDISLSKYIKLKKDAVITFISLTNVFNTKNESSVLYNLDYSNNHFNFYQLRTIYFGFVWQLNE